MIEQYIFIPAGADTTNDKSCGCGPDCRCGSDCACGPGGKCAPACHCAD